MNKQKLLIWSPRVVLILLSLFLSVFSLDVFSEDWPIHEKIIAFFMHLLPSIIILIILWICWKKELLAAWLFLIVAIVAFFFFDFYESIGGFFIIDLPLLLVSLLYLIIHKNKKNEKN